jgi:NSS family neurotransmitter:Na+ symporter
VGVPIVIAEFAIGRKTQLSPVGAFKKLAPDSWWKNVGYLGVASAFVILSFYSVVGGWTLRYTFVAISGGFEAMAGDPVLAKELFGDFVSSTWNPLFWHLIFIGLCIWIIVNGVKYGIERWSKIMMPAIIIILIMLVIRGLTLKNGMLGLEFLFKPKFSDLTANSVVLALGHSFFTLSLGMGTMITYGSYLKKDQNLLSSAFWVIFLDTAIAMLAGIAIFTTVFALGADPAGGAGLIFHVLPSIFAQLPGGIIWGTLFFFLLFLAALTSAISILEVVTAYFIDQKGWSRAKATITFGGVAAAVGIFCSLSLGEFNDMSDIFGVSFFDLMENASSKYMLPIGGMLTAIFIIWRWGVPALLSEMYLGMKDQLLNARLVTILLGFAAFVVFAIIFNELVALFAGESLSEILFGPVD